MNDHKLGDKVLVSGTLMSIYEERFNKTFKLWRRKKVKTPFIGIVIRRCWKQSGIVNGASMHYTNEGDYDDCPAYLDVKRRHLAFEVAFNLNRKTVLCAPSQIGMIK